MHGFSRTLIVLLALLAVAGFVVLVRVMMKAGLTPADLVRDALGSPVSGPAAPATWDPIGDFNAAVDRVPESDRAVTLMAEAFHRLRALGPAPDTSVGPGEDGWMEARAWVGREEVQQAIVVLEEAARRPVLGMKMSSVEDPAWSRNPSRGTTAEPEADAPASPLVMDMMLPYLGIVRWFSGMLSVDGAIALETDDGARFMRSVRTRIGLVRLVKEPNTIISQLIQVAELERSREDIQKALATRPEFIDEPMAAEIEALLADVLGHHLRREMRWERATLEDVLRRMLDESGAYDPHGALAFTNAAQAEDFAAYPPPSAAPVVSMDPGFREVIQQHDRCTALTLASIKTPWTPLPEGLAAEIEAWEQEFPSIPGRIARLWFGICAPKWDKWAATMRTSSQSLAGLRLTLAAHRHRLRHGDPALALADIDPDLIPFDPIDGFTGGDLQYRWTDAGPLIYALGADGDDDGGRHVLGADGEPYWSITDEYLRERPDGDWLLFPAPR